MRPLYGRGIDYPLLLTFGLSIMFVEIVRMTFGLDGIPFSTPRGLTGAVNLGIGHFPLYRLFLIGAAAVVVAFLYLFIEKTSYGLVIRAGARDPEIVRVLGLPDVQQRLRAMGAEAAPSSTPEQFDQFPGEYRRKVLDSDGVEPLKEGLRPQ